MTDVQRKILAHFATSCGEAGATADEVTEALRAFLETPPASEYERFLREQVGAILADPELPAALLNAEDRALFGESVDEYRRRTDNERN